MKGLNIFSTATGVIGTVSSLVLVLALVRGVYGLLAVVNWRMGVVVPLSRMTAVGELLSPVPCWCTRFHSSCRRANFHSSSMQLSVSEFGFGSRVQSELAVFLLLYSSCVIKCFRTIKSKP